ncbi:MULTISPECIES: AMP-binding protein, partial [unclassified Chryseobacterium]|uniref:AMP-binding protein n=1 Tax=unclassified Chryseobacterium TaxID=2593645 RepID=UPI0030104DF7
HEELKKQKNQYKKENLPIISRPDSLAYVIYTSGTTGEPKGVMMQQENILNLIKYHIKTIAPYNKVTFLSNPSFDVSFQEIFSTLLTGATLFPVSDTIKKDIQALTYFISKNKLDVLFFPTAYFKVLIEDDSFLECVGENVKHIIVAGEKLILNNAIFESIKEKPIKIHNHYGPAETHVVTTYVIDEKTVKNYIPPIGKPIANIYVYILNTNKVLCSIGEYGRLYLSGAGLAKGYINKKELTEEKFIANPFIPGSKMYDTGDIARWLPDGNIEFLGRKDFQVKVRGYRIETNEVETVLTKHNSISQTIVDTKEINGDNILIAFYVKKDPTEKLDKSELRDYMQSKVPEYMVPGFFIEIDSVPLTPNGKINRRALPDVKEDDMVRKEYVAPKNETEKKLVKIWQEVLGIEKVGITDSFFELGGNSIKAMQFISILNSRHKMSVELSVLFKNPHIQHIAYSLIMEKKEIERFEEISEPYKLSPQQMNMWISEVKNNTSNIIVTQLTVDELLDINLLKKSIDKIVQRHLSLRTVFITHDNLPLQKIITNDYDKYDINIISEEDLVAQNLENDFSLDEYPLFKIYVIPKQDRFKVVLKIHHLIFDGWSVNLFRNELLTIYKNKNNTLPGTNYEYIDYVNYLKHQNKDILLEYWKNKLKDVPDYLHISNPEKSIDHEVAYTSNYTDFQIDNRSYNEIKKIIKQRGVTLSTFFISCFKILLGRISNTNNITVAIPVANRNDPAFSNIIGLFTNIIFHNDLLNQHASFEKLLDQVHSTSIEALNHADISVHEICDLLKINNTVHTLPLTPVVINILDFIKDNFEYEPGCDDEKDHLTASKFDLEFFVETTSGGVLVSSVFNKDLFNSKEVFFWLKGLGHIIDEVIHHSEKTIEEIEIFDQFLLSDPITPKNDYVDWELEYDSIIDRFDYICETYPDKYAVVDDNQKMTYRELNETSTIISNEIIKHSRNNKVLILLSHGYQSVLGILSTLKAGKAYIPLDISLHTLRTREIIAEINTDLILCDNQTEEFANKFLIDPSLVSVNIERIINQDSQGTMQSLEEIPSADSLAYILYTSGSTGKPKGVMQSHKNVLHFINIYTRQLHIAPEDHLSLIPFYNFDSAVMDIFGGLLNGATLYPFNVNIKGINDLARWIDHHEITIYHSVPTLFRSLIKTIQYRLSSIRLIVLGGEAVFKRDFLGFKNKFGKDAIFINGYGPTESTIVCQKFLDDQSIVGYHVPIGKSVDRTKVYLVKSSNKPARIYEEGEIVYGSDYLALGYYQDETLTNQKFKTKADFQNSDPNLRYYYSGDWGKLLPSGDIEFIGRLDNQIKLNGIRIELNEINFVIEQIEEVAVSVTVFKTFRDSDLIASYICFKAGNSISREAILEILKSSLPAYMVPKSIVILDHIPLTNTGKISFKDLPDIQENDLFKKEFTPAGNVLEKELENIWKDILKIDQIGIHDNFFDIGGTSVRAIELSNKLKINYPDKNISPVIVFEYPNISTLAEFLSTTVTTTDQEQEENLSILETTLNIYNLDHNDYDE